MVRVAMSKSTFDQRRGAQFAAAGTGDRAEAYRHRQRRVDLAGRLGELHQLVGGDETRDRRLDRRRKGLAVRSVQVVVQTLCLDIRVSCGRRGTRTPGHRVVSAVL
jgi:hypothetical protein